MTEQIPTTPEVPATERFVEYNGINIPIPDGASREDIREVMQRRFPELANATMMDLPGGNIRFVSVAGEKGAW